MPLFYRFWTGKDIPTKYFLRRKTIRGRLIRVEKPKLYEQQSSTTTTDASIVEKPIVCHVHHLSPTGQLLLNRTSFDWFVRTSPSTAIGKKLEDDDDLIQVEIAGVQQPPFYLNLDSGDGPGDWLQWLADNRTFVSLHSTLGGGDGQVMMSVSSLESYITDQQKAAAATIHSQQHSGVPALACPSSSPAEHPSYLRDSTLLLVLTTRPRK